MYSGMILTRHSGNVVGTHQKIDKIARKHLGKLIDSVEDFPPIKSILHFEGREGPDGIKRKSPAKDEPWHYLDPFDDTDTQLMELIESHYQQLVKEIRSGSTEHQAFEAAWLAHAIVDGMTPAHHYPYEQELVRLSGGQPISERTSFKKKMVMPGDTRREKFRNNMHAWGPRGLRTAHATFELGVAALAAPLSFAEALPDQDEIEAALKLPVGQLFHRAAREVAVMGIYTSYLQKGWTPRLTVQIRQKLMPLIIQTLTLTWYKAVHDAAQES